MKLKGHRVVDSDEVIQNATKQLKDLSKNGFQKCFEQIYERWKKCVGAGGKYFKGHQGLRALTVQKWSAESFVNKLIETVKKPTRNAAFDNWFMRVLFLLWLANDDLIAIGMQICK
ncbi:hypothetical protein AVEN_107343-1 [Araneus ventricosus]|uniref:Uncharacterized protein n=1 Tax=Araneus ventricosus TaxID=182803 RepID=A0A4Y2HR93_ARAVE|nr:hypothetical protein AVEN_107343-1 [Araneus ventricosus]